MHEKYSAPPEPINWAEYKEAFGNHPEVAKVEDDFKNFVYPVHEPEDPAAIRKAMDPSVRA